jgi:Glycosyltransferase family 87
VLLGTIVISICFRFLAPNAPSFDSNWFDNDFICPYAVCRVILSEEQPRIYDLKTQSDMVNRIKYPLKDAKPILFQYPPFAYIFFVPFAIFPFHLAYRIFQGVTLVFGCCTFAFVYKRFTGWNYKQLYLLLAASLFAFPVWLGFLGGQYHWFFLGVLSLYYCGLLNSRQELAGISLAISSIKLQYMPLNVLATFLLGYKKALVCGALGLLILLCLSGFAFGFENVIDYPKALLHSETGKDVTGVFPQNQICVRGLFVRLLPDHQSAWAAEICYLGALAAGSLVAVVSKTKPYLVKGWALTVVLFLQLVFALHVQFQDCLYIALIVPLTISTKQRDLFVSTKAKTAYYLWIAAILCYPFITWMQPFFDINIYGRLLILVLNFCLLCAAFVCWWFALKSTSASQSS